MALTSTLFTGLSGLDVNQTRLNVVGNNIANVNTVAFKSSRTIFTPQFYVTDSAGSPTTADFGGQNPSQRGLGATVGAIQRDFSGGAIEPTGRATDMAIDGEGFFVIQGTERRFTRDGSFSLNSLNQLVTNSGDYVMGYGVDDNGDVQVGQLDKISIPLGEATLAQATSSVTFKGNLSTSAGGASVLNSQGITLLGGTAAPDGTSLLTNIAEAGTNNGIALFNVGDVLTLDATKGGTALAQSTFTVTATSTVDDLLTFYNTGMGIDTAAPSADGLTPGAALKVDSTSSTAVQIVITGNVGASNALSVTANAPFTYTDDAVLSKPNGTPLTTQFSGYDSVGNPIKVNITAILDSITAAGTTWRFTATSPDNISNPAATIGTGTLVFDTDGKLVTTTGTNITLNRQGTGATSPQQITFDFSAATGLADESSTLQATKQDGYPIGTLSDFSIGSNGIISGSFTNGLQKNLGQIAIATFKNPQGLLDNGSNQFSASASSGLPVVGTPLQLGAGSVRSGSLELSNVDLSKEFTNLIIASTGFSAASKVITTSDQLIQELLNTAR